jgi:hypothetical protein
MGIIKREDIIAWKEDSKIVCDDCLQDANIAKPLTIDDFNDEDIVECDVCEGRIQ